MKSTFNHMGHYVCECGKIFESAQSFNGHKSHCKTHYLAKYGNDEAYTAMNKSMAARFYQGSLKNQAIKLQAKAEADAAWVAAKHTCKTCGRVMTVKYGSGIYCSTSCAHSRTLSEEAKYKISVGVSLAQKAVKTKDFRYCVICGKVIKRYSKTGFCATCLRNTPEGREQMIASGKQGYVTMCKNNTHKPWQSRKIKSYAEQFWEMVLNNNNIPFSREVAIKHNKSNYFLDFLIEVNGKLIDLEIDGKQHKYTDRVASDNERDTYLSELGYIVYRIPWNSINKESGKVKMQEKINKFLAFYASIRSL